MEVTKCRSFVLAYHDENSPSDAVIAIYNRFEGRWYDRKYRCVVSLDAELRRHFKLTPSFAGTSNGTVRFT